MAGGAKHTHQKGEILKPPVAGYERGLKQFFSVKYRQQVAVFPTSLSSSVQIGGPKRPASEPTLEFRFEVRF